MDPSLKINQASFADIRADIFDLKNKIEKLCKKNKGTPSDLGTPTYRQYLWVRFLSNANNLLLHLKGLQTFHKIIKNQNTQKNSVNQIQIKIEYSGYLYQRKTSRGNTTLLINACFVNANEQIKQKLINAAFAKRRNKASEEIKSYANSDLYIEMGKRIAGDPIANSLSCKGKYYDLARLFHNINSQYFDAKLPQPRLVWSSSRAQRRLGYYHPEIHTIAINKKFDSRHTSQILIDYILYHEMLHQFFGIEHRNGRRYAHTTAFHKAEKNFKGYKEAENLIKLLH